MFDKLPVWSHIDLTLLIDWQFQEPIDHQLDDP